MSKIVRWVSIALLAVLPAVAIGKAGAQQQTVLTLSGTGVNPPFHFLDPATGEQVGITMELFAAIAADLGMTLNIVPTIPLADMVTAIQTGVVDTYAGNITVTPARAAEVAFADPWYFNFGEGAWVLKTDTGSYRSVRDFAGRVVGAQSGSATHRGLEALGIFPEIRLYDDQDLLAQAVIAGEVSVGFLPFDTSAYILFQGLYPELRIPEGYEGTVNYGFLYAMPFSRDNPELVERVNGSLARLAANGTLQDIFARYGLDWRLPRAIR